MVDRQVARRASGKRRTAARSPVIRARGTAWSAFLANVKYIGGTAAAKTYMGRSVPVMATLEDIGSTNIATETPSRNSYLFCYFPDFFLFFLQRRELDDCVPDDDLRALNDVCVQ